MGRFDGYLFCSDIDGTLILNGIISDENAEAIRYFQSEGGLFTVATGRNAEHIKGFADRVIPNTHLVCLNGAVLAARDGSILFEDRISKEKSDEVFEFVKANAEEKLYIYGFGSKGSVPYEQIFENPYKMVFVSETADEALRLKEMLIEKFGDSVIFMRSWPTGLEMINKTAGKDVCTRKLKELVGAKKLLCIGDFENDLAMIKEADIGIAVANAIDELKAAADIVTESDASAAIAEIIKSL